MQNLDDNRIHRHLVEFILVDFGSKDGLREWVGNNCMADIESGFLKYYYTETLKSWNAPIAKNTSHRLGNHDILVNLDCDNYTGPSGGMFVIGQFMHAGEDIVLHQLYDMEDGSYGRIGVRRGFFHAIGGYNEAFKPMLYEDVDLIKRLRILGLNYLHVPNNRYSKTIPNLREESFVNIDHKVDSDDLNRSNMAISNAGVADGRLVVNKNRAWGIREGLFDVYDNPVSLRE
jgi:hypothetical protein